MGSSGEAGEQFQALVLLMARLRALDGCPWDLAQTFDSIKKHTLEETYEVLDAIERQDWPGLSEELGDYLLQAVFYAQMAEEQSLFNITDSLEAINHKLIRRHPHIFGDAKADTADDVKRRWDEIKSAERQQQGKQPTALLDKVSRSQPALMESQQVGSAAAQVGFDWPSAEPVLEKIEEEVAEVRAAATPGEREAEIGDLLFAVVNLARHYKVDAEQALRGSTRRFRSRFGHVEQSLQAQGRRCEDSTLDEMEALWQEAKQKA